MAAEALCSRALLQCTEVSLAACRAHHHQLSRRRYATESVEYRQLNRSGPPPPPASPSANSGSGSGSGSTSPQIPHASSSRSSILSPTPSPGRSQVQSSGGDISSPSSTSAFASTSAGFQGDANVVGIPADAEPPLQYAQNLSSEFGKNQLLASQSAVSPEVQQDLEAILADFRAPIRYAFAYGSGVFKQAGYAQDAKPMLDFVFAVSHPNHWHSINLHQHKDHYSVLARIFGSSLISILQEKVGAGVWFNVECLVRGRVIKYGVISVDALVKDLLDWETLYMAGRMHKPIHVLRDEPRIRLANQVNLSSAVRASMLLLPETFSEEDLYREITSLSYRGDFRMQVGENPNKIKNIVQAQYETFSKLYQPILRSFHKHISFLGPEGSGSIRQDINPKAKADLARRLPSRLRDMLQNSYERDVNIGTALGRRLSGVVTSSDEASSGSNNATAVGHSSGSTTVKISEETAMWRRLVSQGDFKTNLDKCIQMTVARPAFSQSMKGVASVGPLRGVRYVWPKLQKKWFPQSQ